MFNNTLHYLPNPETSKVVSMVSLAERKTSFPAFLNWSKRWLTAIFLSTLTSGTGCHSDIIIIVPSRDTCKAVSAVFLTRPQGPPREKLRWVARGVENANLLSCIIKVLSCLVLMGQILGSVRGGSSLWVCLFDFH